MVDILTMKKRVCAAEGHLIDTGNLSLILNTILSEGGDYHIVKFTVGKTPDKTSSLEFELIASGTEELQALADKLTQLGVFEKQVPSAQLEPVEINRHAPERFYVTTNHRTEVYFQGKWYEVLDQRMDAALAWDGAQQSFSCRKLRELKQGDLVVCGSDSVRVYPAAVAERIDGFSFMSNEVSSERSDRAAIYQVAQAMTELKKSGGKTVVVCGPVVVHTGASGYLANMIRHGYIQGFLSGNAVAVHDLEAQFFGTSLGVDLETGKVVEHGHNHHMRAINAIYKYGSIADAVKAGVITGGLMYEIVASGIPYCLAGSIRDDGPLPETENDMIEAQRQYAEIIHDADMIIMLSTMLHAIGTGNMTPSWVKMICIDINPAVVTKLADRGSAQTMSIVSDVGLFLKALAEQLEL